MGKETSDLWDDSALINAFDQALTKYKMMHIGTAHHDTTEGETSTSNKNDHSVDEMHENVEPDEERNGMEEAATEMNALCSNSKTAHELSSIQESQPENGTCLSESHPELAGATSTHDKMSSYAEAEHARLLSQYYEIEEKRQNILQQLQQMSYWNYPYSAQYQTPHVHQGTDTSHVGALSPCCLCLGHCCACALSSSSFGPVCPWDASKFLSQTHQMPADVRCVIASNGDPMPTCKLDTAGQSVYANSSAVETAKTTAERVVSSVEYEASAVPNVYEEEKHKGREETFGVGGGQMTQNVELETDLTTVMNAWYSAGFYTGRYLLEQSMKKGRH